MNESKPINGNSLEQAAQDTRQYIKSFPSVHQRMWNALIGKFLIFVHQVESEAGLN